jgi:hypothetical protein
MKLDFLQSVTESLRISKTLGDRSKSDTCR